MARSRKSHNSNEEKVKVRGLEPPRGACGDNPYVIYCDLRREGEEHHRVLILNFKAKYAARRFIQKLLHGDGYEPCDPVGSRTGILTSSGIRITAYANQVDMLLEYEPTEAEAAWEDEQLSKSVLQFKYGSSESRTDLPVTPEERSEKREKSNRVREASPPKEKKTKVDTSGHVSANDIAKELKVEGREVRGVLRSLKLEKPAHGWSWPKDEAAKIRSQVEKALGAAKKEKK